LANADAGKYLNDNFVSTYQKVGTFTINRGQKQGGNVASYFCTPDGRVLQALAGPVKADVLLREARWVVETKKLAELDGIKSEARLRLFWRKAHGDRLTHEHHVDMKLVYRSPHAAQRLSLNDPGRVHLLLAMTPLPKLERVYRTVFEDILGEKVSTAPVARNGG
jgi:hypothetical protein